MGQFSQNGHLAIPRQSSRAVLSYLEMGEVFEGFEVRDAPDEPLAGHMAADDVVHGGLSWHIDNGEMRVGPIDLGEDGEQVDHFQHAVITGCACDLEPTRRGFAVDTS